MAGHVHKNVVAVAAVHRVIVRAPTASVHRNDPWIVAAVKQISRPIAIARRVAIATTGRCSVVLKWKFGARIARSQPPQLCRRRINHRRLSAYFDGFGRATNLQCDVHADDFIQVQHDVLYAQTS